jgi:two-component system response regulator QseB
VRVLLVEDDKIIGDGVSIGLDGEGYAIDWVEDIESAETALDTNDYGLAILDIGLSDGSGLDLLRKIRKQQKNFPIIMLTAYDDVSYKVKGLDSGADDYLIKPFKLDELKARLRALRRRNTGKATPMINVGNISINPASHEVLKDGVNINLGPKEFSILHVLLENAGKIISKKQLEDHLYSWDNEIESNTVEVHIHGLRKKLGKDFIETIKFVGYRVNK